MFGFEDKGVVTVAKTGKIATICSQTFHFWEIAFSQKQIKYYRQIESIFQQKWIGHGVNRPIIILLVFVLFFVLITLKHLQKIPRM